MADYRLQVLDLVTELQKKIEVAGKVPLTNRVVLDRQEINQIAEQIRGSLDPDLTKAQDVLANQIEILTSSQQKADQTLSEAENGARATLDDAARRAQATLADAQAKASEMARDAADKANAMVADAQARAQAMLADAQARAAQLVSENEITLRANQEAEHILSTAQAEADRFRSLSRQEVHGLMANADAALSQQLDALRQLRQNLDAVNSQDIL